MGWRWAFDAPHARKDARCGERPTAIPAKHGRPRAARAARAGDALDGVGRRAARRLGGPPRDRRRQRRRRRLLRPLAAPRRGGAIGVQVPGQLGPARLGGGGAGAASPGVGGQGTDGLGGGGGGSCFAGGAANVGGAGGDGVVILRMPTANKGTFSNATESTDGSDTILTFATGSGTYNS